MEENQISLKHLIYPFIMGLILFSTITLTKIGDTRTRIVFCDVGQGNAAYLRIANRIDLLVDAGPDMSVVECLGRHMPFFDRNIELIIITHSDSDHYGGLTYLMERFVIKEIIINDIKKTDLAFRKIISKANEDKIPLKPRFSGDRIKLADSLITFYWPSANFIQPKGNETSSIFSFDQRGFRLLFTGDSPPQTLNRLSYRDVVGTDILMVPHHGSKNGLTEKFLRLANPTIAVISVDKNNPFGHPHKSTLDLIEAKKIKIKRTDEDGDILFILGGSTLFP
jgi:competence protein ComEC